MPNHSTGTILISIHAPVKGATREGSVPEGPGQISIHAPVKGATSRATTVSDSHGFQSTLP